MWMPKYDDSIRANYQTLALVGFKRVMVKEQRGDCEIQREKSEGDFGCLSLSMPNKSLLGFPGKGGGKNERHAKGGAGWVISAEGF